MVCGIGCVGFGFDFGGWPCRIWVSVYLRGWWWDGLWLFSGWFVSLPTDGFCVCGFSGFDFFLFCSCVVGLLVLLF